MIIIIVFPPLHPCSRVRPGYVVRRVADPAIGSCFATRISCSILPVYRVDTTVDSGKSLQGPTCYSLHSRALSVKLTRSSPMSRYYVPRSEGTHWLNHVTNHCSTCSSGVSGWYATSASYRNFPRLSSEPTPTTYAAKMYGWSRLPKV
jgi:hypothetical protein